MGHTEWTSRVSADSASVGDLLTLEVSGRWPQEGGPAHLAWGLPADTLLLVSRDSARAESDSVWAGADYRLRFLATRSGRFTLPPVALVDAAGDTLSMTETHALVVGGRLAPDEDVQLRPLAEMVSLDRFPVVWMAAAVALLVAAAGTLWWWLRRRRMGEEVAAIPLPPPAVEFAERLEALELRGLPARGEMRVYVQQLSWVLRRYLGRRFEEPAVEATRPEILRWLPRTVLAVKDQRVLADWLARTDAIKFAGVTPLLSETEELTAEARRIVARSEAAFQEHLGEGAPDTLASAADPRTFTRSTGTAGSRGTAGSAPVAGSSGATGRHGAAGTTASSARAARTDQGRGAS